MAFFACGTRDKLNARPAGATRYFVDGGSLFGNGLIFLDARRSWSLWAWGAFAFPQLRTPGGFESLRLLPLNGKSRCGEPVAGMGRRDSASAFSAAAPRCVASLLACCAGKRFAFPQLRTLAGSNPSACPQESALGRYGLRALNFNGWDGGIRTPNSRHQKPEFYR